METAEIHIVVTPDGFDRAEVLTSSTDQQTQDLAMQAYGQIAFEIYQFRRRVDQILAGKDVGPDGQGIRVFS